MSVKKFGNMEGAPNWDIPEKHKAMAESLYSSNPEWVKQVFAAYLADILVETSEKKPAEG